jgi:hypothetical protein
LNGPNRTGNQTAIQFPHMLSNGHFKTGLFCLVLKCAKNKMVVKIGPVLAWPVPTKIDHSKTRLDRFSGVYCNVETREHSSFFVHL